MNFQKMMPILLGLLLAIFSTSCTKDTPTPTTYVLVHGAWHGAWCWEKLKTELESRGHKVVTLDMPGHGDDKTDLKTVTMDSYINAVGDLVNKEANPVILVGHSMGGLVTASVAEKYPSKIKSLVFLAAFLPKNGESLLSIEGRNPNPTIPMNLIPSADTVYFDLVEANIQSLFYGDCTAADVTWAKSKLTSQAIAPLATPVSLTDANYGSVTRYYIECKNDGAVSIDLQKDMYTASPCKAVFTMNTSHSPFISAPADLADILDGL